MNRHASRLIHQAASLLLSYPGEDWTARLDLVRAALGGADGTGGAAAQRLRGFCAEAAALPALDAGAAYVATFDRSGRRTLHMTYYGDGDTRRRGESLLELKTLYRDHGWQPGTGELPDYLPVMLEFAARVPGPGGRLLRDHRPGLDLLHTGLTARRSRYAAVVEAVLLTLPRATSADRRTVDERTALGPPAERVGRTVLPEVPGGVR